MMRRKKPVKSKIPKEKDIIDRFPLVKGSDGIDNPDFLDKLKKGVFDKEDLPYPERGGPRIKFKNDFTRQVYYLARMGARICDIAEFFNVSHICVDKWKQQNVDFREAYLEGHWLFGMKVGETLGQRALGYSYTEIEKSQHVDRQGEIRDLVKTTTKHMPPDVTAIIFYLKNRFRDSWMDVHRAEIDARIDVDISKKLDMEVLTDDEKAMIKSIAIKNISSVHGVSDN